MFVRRSEPVRMWASHGWVSQQHQHESPQEEFGVKARKEGREWLMTRIPARLFRDGAAKGALFTVCEGERGKVCVYMFVSV